MKRRRPFKSRLRNAFLTVSGILGIGASGVVIETLPKDPTTDTQILTTYNIGTSQQRGYNISFIDQFWKQSLAFKAHDALVADMIAAAKDGDSWRVSTVLKHGGIDLQKDAGLALVEATRSGHMDVISVLLQAGVKANALNDAPFLAAMDVQNYTLALRYADLAKPSAANLHQGAVMAAGAGSLATLDALITRGVDITAQNNSLLVAASGGGQIHIIQRLLQEKTTQTVTEYIQTPNAYYGGYYDSNSDFMTHDQNFGYDAFQPGCTFFPEDNLNFGGPYEHPPLSQTTVEKTIDVYKVDLNADNGMPLKMAAINGEEAAFKILVDAGADIRVAGQEILSNAVASGNASLVQYILSQNAIGLDYTGLAFAQAVGLNNYQMAAAFVDIKADTKDVLKMAEQKGDAIMIAILKGETKTPPAPPHSPFSPRALR